MCVHCFLETKVEQKCVSRWEITYLERIKISFGCPEVQEMSSTKPKGTPENHGEGRSWEAPQAAINTAVSCLHSILQLYLLHFHGYHQENNSPLPLRGLPAQFKPGQSIMALCLWGSHGLYVPARGLQESLPLTLVDSHLLEVWSSPNQVQSDVRLTKVIAPKIGNLHP